jgi:N-methylhydantoinase B/oxoprolinase/acetone carboxylase alpha subunit
MSLPPYRQPKRISNEWHGGLLAKHRTAFSVGVKQRAVYIIACFSSRNSSISSAHHHILIVHEYTVKIRRRALLLERLTMYQAEIKLIIPKR